MYVYVYKVLYFYDKIYSYYKTIYITLNYAKMLYLYMYVHKLNTFIKKTKVNVGITMKT